MKMNIEVISQYLGGFFQLIDICITSASKSGIKMTYILLWPFKNVTKTLKSKER